jgi:hypothetical protein
MNKREVIAILERERNYEEEISSELHDLYLSSLPNIEGISKKEKEELKKQITLLRDETIIHKKTFEELIDYVGENDRDNY